MVDIAKHADFWKKGALEDWDISDQLLQNGKIRHALFFTHLALEKLLIGIVLPKNKKYSSENSQSGKIERNHFPFFI